MPRLGRFAVTIRINVSRRRALFLDPQPEAVTRPGHLEAVGRRLAPVGPRGHYGGNYLCVLVVAMSGVWCEAPVTLTIIQKKKEGSLRDNPPCGVSYY